MEAIFLRRDGAFGYGFIQFRDAVAVEMVLSKSKHRIGRHLISVKAANAWYQPGYKQRRMRPAHDAPSNILNALNDQCIYEIFKFLEFSDLVNVAEVCVRFNEQAKKTFATSKHKRIILYSGDLKVNKIMNTFGANMQSLWIQSTTLNSTHDNSVLRSILKYRSDKLKELRLEYFRIDREISNFGPILSQLETFELLYSTVNTNLSQSITDCDKLKLLRFECCPLMHNDSFIARKFSNLKEAHLWTSDFNIEFIREFIVSNSTIVRLSINQFFDNSHVINLIGEHMTHLQELEYVDNTIDWTPAPVDIQDVNRFRNELLGIGRLLHLKTLKLVLNQSPVGPLLAALVENNISIKHLKMGRVLIDDAAIKSLMQMKELKILEFIDVRDTLTRYHLIDMVKFLLNLQELHLINTSDIIDINVIKTILKHATHLSLLKLKFCGNLSIDINDFSEILLIIEQRVMTRVIIEIEIEQNERININVPNEILNTHSHQCDLIVIQR